MTTGSGVIDKSVSVQQPVKVPALDTEDECAEREPVGMENGAGFRTLPDGYVTVVGGDLYAVVAAAASEFFREAALTVSAPFAPAREGERH